MVRTAREIAGQAIVYGSLGFRASLEVTVHPRSAEISSRLLPWLEKLGLGEQIEPFHREILESPRGQWLSEHRTEAYWRGEGAAVLGWSVQLLDTPDRDQRVDPTHLAERLKLLRPEAADLLNNAALRPKQQLDDFCAFCMAVRTEFQKSSVGEEPGRILDTVLRKRMSELGLHDVDRATEDAANFAGHCLPPPRGLYAVRAMAAEWLLGSDDGARGPVVAE